MAIRGDESKPVVKTPIPGPKAREVVAADGKHLVTTTKTAPIVARQARGVVLHGPGVLPGVPLGVLGLEVAAAQRRDPAIHLCENDGCAGHARA